MISATSNQLSYHLLRPKAAKLPAYLRSESTPSKLSDMQNGHVESFTGKLRDECLNTCWFRNLFDARSKIAKWRDEYNYDRPHSSLGYMQDADVFRIDLRLHDNARTVGNVAGLMRSSYQTTV